MKYVSDVDKHRMIHLVLKNVKKYEHRIDYVRYLINIQS